MQLQGSAQHVPTSTKGDRAGERLPEQAEKKIESAIASIEHAQDIAYLEDGNSETLNAVLLLLQDSVY